MVIFVKTSNPILLADLPLRNGAIPAGAWCQRGGVRAGFALADDPEEASIAAVSLYYL